MKHLSQRAAEHWLSLLPLASSYYRQHPTHPPAQPPPPPQMAFYKTWIRGLCTYLQFAGLFLWVIILFLADAALSNYTSPHLLLCYARLARLHKITKQALHNLEISISCFSFFLCFSRFSTSPSTHVSLKRTRSQSRLYRVLFQPRPLLLLLYNSWHSNVSAPLAHQKYCLANLNWLFVLWSMYFINVTFLILSR